MGAVPSPVAHPIQTLRDHTASFMAALAVCAAEPKIRNVHKLRTESRRLEAQIALLKALQGLPPFRARVAKALLQIKKLRQAAGQVRDLDVQCGHLQDYVSRIDSADRSHAEKQQIIADVGKMVAVREERRLALAVSLQHVISTRGDKVSLALERLNTALTSALKRRTGSAELIDIARTGFEKDRVLQLKKPSADDLHTIRKAAKQARYLAENAGSKAASIAAKRYEQLQECGGEWHDWLDLAAAAKKELGKRHTVVAEFVMLRERNLEIFQRHLQKFRLAAAAAGAVPSAPSKGAVAR